VRHVEEVDDRVRFREEFVNRVVDGAFGWRDTQML
jgi:hypothetical protein